MKLQYLPEIIIPEIKTTKRLKIFYVADIQNWSFHLKGNIYKKHLKEFDVDIGFASSSDWIQHSFNKHYDVIVHLHEQYIKDEKMLLDFIKRHNERGTKVVLTINEVICPYDLMLKKKKLLLYNSISVNNPYVLENLKKIGFKNIFTTYDGVDLDTFFVEKLYEQRKYNIFFSSSKIRMMHKGYEILQDVKFILKEHKDIKFKEIYTDSYENKITWQEMRKHYNECKIFLCLSQSEGGPCTLLESAACGCVPISTDVGYTNYFHSCHFIKRTAESCAKKILELKNNQEILNNNHIEILQEIKKWDSSLLVKQWGKFWEESYCNTL